MASCRGVAQAEHLLQVGAVDVAAEPFPEVVAAGPLPEGLVLDRGLAELLQAIPFEVAEGQHAQVDPSHDALERPELVLAQSQFALELLEELLYLPPQGVPMEQILRARL